MPLLPTTNHSMDIEHAIEHLRDFCLFMRSHEGVEVRAKEEKPEHCKAPIEMSPTFMFEIIQCIEALIKYDPENCEIEQ
jgi:hypothetical protein